MTGLLCPGKNTRSSDRLDLGATRRGLHAHLGEPDRVDAFDADLGHRGERHRQLSLAAVDDDQVRQIGFFLPRVKRRLSISSIMPKSSPPDDASMVLMRKWR